MSPPRRLLLVGGGHAHLGVLAAAGRLSPQATITLVDAAPRALYSGMVPGVIAGHHAPADCMIDLGRVARRAQATFIEARAIALDPGARQLHLADGRPLDYDLLSLDVGGAPPATAPHAPLPPTRAPVLPCRPFEPLLESLADIDRRALEGRLRIAVAGAGLAGVEVALALAWRLRARPLAEVRLVCSAATPVPELPARARAAVVRACARAGVTLVIGGRFAGVSPDGGLVLADGRPLEADLVLTCTGARPPAWLASSGLALDTAGHVAVDAALASLSHPEVFAAGDCASVRGHPRPRSGVLAVRQGPRLADSLARWLAGRPPRARPPQRHALALVGLGPPLAMAVRAGRVLGGAAGPGDPGGWVADTLARGLWRWKCHIDHRFVRRHR